MLEKLLAKRHIKNLDLTSVRIKLVEKMGWSWEQARRVEGDYKRFLYALAHKRPDDLLSPPTQEVDEFWHQHILDTRKYREDCETIFGHYVDHTPGLDPEKQRRADQRRQEVYTEYDIEYMSFDSGDDHSRRDSGFGDSGGSHSAHSHHDSGSIFGHDSSHGCDSSGHSSDGGSCDGGGGDGGGGDGGFACGGGGCGGR